MKGKRWGFFLCLIFGLPFLASAQYYHRLAASDFQGTPPAGEQSIAYTYCDVTYNYHVKGYTNNFSIDFTVDVVFSHEKSFIHFNWIKNQDMLQQILRHEQGHYNMAFLMRAELYRAFRQAHYTANYAQEIAAIFKRVDAKYQKLNDDYERQTEHMLNDAKQDEWNAWFSRAIDNVPVRMSLAER